MGLDAVVVGAGISGLCAARRMQAAGLRVAVVEARDRVGGRTLSQRLGNDVIDLGGQWVGPKQHRIVGLARELGLKTFPQHVGGKKVMEIQGAVRTYRGFLPRVSLVSMLEVGATLARVEWLSRSVPLDEPWAARRATEWDSLSVEGFKQRTLRTAEARTVFDYAVRSIFAAEPSEISFLFFLFYMRAGHGVFQLTEAEGGAQQDRFVDGAQSVSLRMAAQLRGAGVDIALSAPVRAVSQTAEGVKIDADGVELTARRAVLALPPALVNTIAFSPELPLARRHLNERMPMGSVIKCIAVYERPFWRERGFSGEALSDGNPVRLVFDDSSHDGRQAALVAFVLGAAVRKWADAPEDALRAAVLAHLAQLLGPEAHHATHFVAQNWPAEVYSRGCYVGVPAPGVLTELGTQLRAPCGAVHWAGTETAREGCGYFEGAVEAGERAADEVVAALAREAVVSV